MILIGLIIVYSLGFSILILISKNNLRSEFTIYELLGLSFIIGIGIETFFMFFLDLINMRINVFTLLFLSLITIGLISWARQKHIREFYENFKKIQLKPNLKGFDTAWAIILLIIIFLILASAIKSLYWPTTSYDSVAGFDLMGKAIATEGKIHVSLFKTGSTGARGIYPPLIEGSFAFAYFWGSQSSKIITSLTFLSLIIVFYALLRKYVSSLNAIIFSLLLIAVPEMFAHSSLSLTNMPNATYAALGSIYLFLWLDNPKRCYLYLASILLGLNVWTRTDSVVFNISGLIILVYYSVKNKSWKEILIYFCLAFFPFLWWMLYLKFKIGIMPDRFVNHLFWDIDRISKILKWIKLLVFNENIYGLTFYIFVVAVLINIKNLFNKNLLILLFILMAFLLYAGIYYQLDDLKQDPLDSMMKNSFKRGLFCFIPLVLFYTSTSKSIHQLFLKIDKFRFNK